MFYYSNYKIAHFQRPSTQVIIIHVHELVSIIEKVLPKSAAEMLFSQHCGVQRVCRPNNCNKIHM